MIKKIVLLIIIQNTQSYFILYDHYQKQPDPKLLEVMTNGFRLDVTNTELFFQYCIQHNKDDQQKLIVIKQLLDQLAEQPIEIQKLFYKPFKTQPKLFEHYCLKIKQYQDLKDFIQSQETSYVNKAFSQQGRILATFGFCILNNINKKHDILFIDQYQINKISKKNPNVKKLQITSCYSCFLNDFTQVIQFLNLLRQFYVHKVLISKSVFIQIKFY